MSIYPSLEDMVVDHCQRAEMEQRNTPVVVTPSAPEYASYQPFSYTAATSPPPSYGAHDYAPPPQISNLPPTSPNASAYLATSSYPSLFDDYNQWKVEPPTGPIAAPRSASQTNTSLNNLHVNTNHNTQQQQVIASGIGGTMVAPLSGMSPGLARANLTHGVRQVIICKDSKGKVGMRFRSVNKGIFVQFVASGSTAALAGIRFGDQILQIDGQDVLGMTKDKAMSLLSKCKDPKSIAVTIRDRPFERAITLHKDSGGHLGFTHRDNEITAIVRDSSAARNGLLVNHHLLEVNGQTVIGMKSKDVKKLLDEAGQTVTLTIMPSELYLHMIKQMDMNLLKKQDHSVPDI